MAFIHPLFKISNEVMSYRHRKLYKVRVRHFWKKYFVKVLDSRSRSVGDFRQGIASFICAQRGCDKAFDSEFVGEQKPGKVVRKQKPGKFALTKSLESVQSLIRREYMLESMGRGDLRFPVSVSLNKTRATVVAAVPEF